MSRCPASSASCSPSSASAGWPRPPPHRRGGRDRRLAPRPGAEGLGRKRHRGPQDLWEARPPPRRHAFPRIDAAAPVPFEAPAPVVRTEVIEDGLRAAGDGDHAPTTIVSTVAAPPEPKQETVETPVIILVAPPGRAISPRRPEAQRDVLQVVRSSRRRRAAALESSRLSTAPGSPTLQRHGTLRFPPRSRLALEGRPRLLEVDIGPPPAAASCSDRASRRSRNWGRRRTPNRPRRASTAGIRWAWRCQERGSSTISASPSARSAGTGCRRFPARSSGPEAAGAGPASRVSGVRVLGEPWHDCRRRGCRRHPRSSMRRGRWVGDRFLKAGMLHSIAVSTPPSLESPKSREYVKCSPGPGPERRGEELLAVAVVSAAPAHTGRPAARATASSTCTGRRLVAPRPKPFAAGGIRNERRSRSSTGRTGSAPSAAAGVAPRRSSPDPPVMPMCGSGAR